MPENILSKTKISLIDTHFLKYDSRNSFKDMLFNLFIFF